MGYQTEHELTIIEGSNGLIEELRSECERAGWALKYSGDSAKPCKWYSHENDLKAFSKKHPDALFMLSGKGEENGDAWHEYYRNGKVQVCKAKLVYPVFNADLLA
jgi:hypothetical protein